MAGNQPTPHRYHLNALPTARTRRLPLFLSLLLAALDIVMLSLAFILSYEARNVLSIFARPANPPTLATYIPTMALHVTLIFVIFYVSRLYHQPRALSRIDQMRRILGAVTVGAVLTFGVQGLIFKATPFEVDYPRAMFFYAWIFSAVFVGVGREVFRLGRDYLRKKGIDSENLLIIGTGKIARDITQRIKSNADLGYRIVGVVSNSMKGSVQGVPIIGAYRDIPMLIDTCGVEQVIIALPDARRSELIDLITLCQRGHVDIKVYPDMFDYMAGDLNVDELGGTPLITVRDIALRGWKLSLKRGLDVFGAFLGLVLFSPFMLLTAFLIKLESVGPVFHIQERMERNLIIGNGLPSSPMRS